ncbi:MAG: DNA alkylation repair protein [Mobilitalea sp.]
MAISDLLLLDNDDLVRKGYGWMLKVLSIKEPQLVFDYLVKNKDVMPRVSFRYAVEKMNKDRKVELMRL